MQQESEEEEESSREVMEDPFVFAARNITSIR